MTLRAGNDLAALTLDLLAGRWTIAPAIGEDGRRCYTATRVAPCEERRWALSSSEREVLLRVLNGESNKEIAYELGVGTSGVSTLLTRARRKLGGRVPEELLSCLVGAAS